MKQTSVLFLSCLRTRAHVQNIHLLHEGQFQNSHKGTVFKLVGTSVKDLLKTVMRIVPFPVVHGSLNIEKYSLLVSF